MKNILFITLPFKSHYYPVFNLAKDYANNGYKVYFTGNQYTEAFILTEHYNCISVNYMIETQIINFKNAFGYFLKSISDKGFRRNKYKDFYKVQNSIVTAIRTLKPIKIFLEINISEYYLFFQKFNIETELFSIYLPTQRRSGIPPLNSNFVPNGGLISNILCEILWYQYQTKKKVQKIIQETAFWKCSDDFFLNNICKKNGIKISNVLSSDFFHSKGIKQLKNNIMCAQNLEFSNFKAFDNEVFQHDYKNRGRFHENDPNSIEIIELVRAEKAKGKKLVIMSFGTFAYGNRKADTFIENIFEIIQNTTNIFLVVSHLGEFKVPHSDKILISQWIPQLQVLKFTDLMITHGGLGTYKECVDAGVKMLVAPINLELDQLGNAARIEANGYGKRISLNSSKEKISYELLKFLS